ncbi:MAG: hypothetical protein R3C19_25680 [Planctomycetaceae bacterium]
MIRCSLRTLLQRVPLCLSATARRPRRTRRARIARWSSLPAAQQLEDRTLLAVTSVFAGGTLTVTADAADNIVVTGSGGDVKINGSDPDSGAVSASAVDFIEVTAIGDFANTIDMSGVTAADGFSSPVLSLRLAAGAGDDFVIGSPFQDSIDGGDGNDLLTGGAGDDQYEFFVTAGTSHNDVIDESGGGIDFVCVFTDAGGAILDLSTGAAQTVFSDATSLLTLTLGSSAAIENACLNFGGNTLIGNDLDNTLNAGGIVIGGNGNDTLFGLEGSDDTLVGGFGDDTYLVLGGRAQGTDTFDEASGDGSDTFSLLSYDHGDGTGVTVDLDDTAAQSFGSGGGTFQFSGSIENFVGSPFPDTLRIDALSGITRLVEALAPDVGASGDTLEVDLANTAFTHNTSAAGDGMIDVSFAGGTGTVGYSGIETLSLLNQPSGGGAAAPLEFSGTAANENLILRLNAARDTVELIDADSNALLMSQPIALTSAVVINTLAGTDSLTIDESNGLINVPGGIQFNGGDRQDSLRFAGTINVAATYRVGPEASGGFIERIGPGATSLVSFTGLEPIFDATPGTLTLFGTNADNAVNLANGPNSGVMNAVNSTGAATGIAAIDGFETYEFANKSVVTIDGLAGQDVFGISNLASGLVPGGIVVVQGGDPADGDELIVSGTPGDDIFGYLPHPELPDAGVITGLGGGLLFFGIEDVTVAGGTGSDAITTIGNSGTSTRSFTTTVPDSEAAKIFAAAFASEGAGGADPSLAASGAGGLHPFADAGNNDDAPFHAAVIAGAAVPDGLFDVTFTVGSSDGQNIGEFDLIGGVVGLSEFQPEAEPNNAVGDVDPIAVTIDQSGRIARTGQVVAGSGDVDLIAVNINNSDRVTNPILNGDISVNINNSDEIVGGGDISLSLGGAGAVVLTVDDNGQLIGGRISVTIDQSGRVAGTVTGGQVSVTIDQSGRVLRGPISVTIDQSGRVINGEIAVTIDQSGRVLGGEVAVTIDQSGRVGVIVNNDPNGNGEFTAARLRLLGADGETEILSGSNIPGAASTSLLSMPLESGIYYLEVTNGSADGESDYEIVVFPVFNSAAREADANNSSPQTAISYTAAQHGRGSISSASRDDLVQIRSDSTPNPSNVGNGTVVEQTWLRFNESTPLTIVDVEQITIDPGQESDSLRFLDTNENDVFRFEPDAGRNDTWAIRANGQDIRFPTQSRDPQHRLLVEFQMGEGQDQTRIDVADARDQIIPQFRVSGDGLQTSPGDLGAGHGYSGNDRLDYVTQRTNADLTNGTNIFVNPFTQEIVNASYDPYAYSLSVVTDAGGNQQLEYSLAPASFTRLNPSLFYDGVGTINLLKPEGEVRRVYFQGLPDVDDTLTFSPHETFVSVVHEGSPRGTSPVFTVFGGDRIRADLAFNLGPGVMDPGHDQIVINGTSGDDSITWLRETSRTWLAFVQSTMTEIEVLTNGLEIDASVQLEQVVGNDSLPFNPLRATPNLESLVLNGAAGNDGFFIRPGIVPIKIDGGDPIATSPTGDLVNILADNLDYEFFTGVGLAYPVRVNWPFAGPENDSGSVQLDAVQFGQFADGPLPPVSFDRIERVVVSGAGVVGQQQVSRIDLGSTLENLTLIPGEESFTLTSGNNQFRFEDFSGTLAISTQNQLSSLQVDLSTLAGNVRVEQPEDEPTEPGSTAQLITGLGGSLITTGFGNLVFDGDGNDNLTVATPRVPGGVDETGVLIGLLRVVGNTAGQDAILIGLLRTALNASGLDNLTIESTNGHSSVEFDFNTLGGANSYTANLRATDVGIISGGDATSDELTARRFGNVWNPTGVRIVGSGPEVRFAGVGGLRFNGRGGDDVLMIDESEGVISLPGGLFFDGGDGRDTLLFRGTQVVDSVYDAGPGTADGLIERTSMAGVSRVTFSGLEPIIDSTPGTLTVSGTNADNAIGLTTGPNSGITNSVNPFGLATGVVSIDGNETYEFAGKSSVTLDGLGGSDVFGISSLSAGLSVGGVVVVHGAEPADADEIRLAGTAGDDMFAYQPHPASAAAGTLSLDRNRLEFFGIEHIAVNGRSGTDTFEAFGDIGTAEEQESGSPRLNDAVELTPLGYRESRLRFNNSTPLELADFETVTVNPSSGIDQLKVFGTVNSDVLTFDAATLTVNGQTFGHFNTEIFAAFGNSGDDTFGVTSGLNGAFTVDGGDGLDLLSVVTPAGSPVGLALPGTIIDSRTIESAAVEGFAVNAGSESVVIAGAPDTVSRVSLTPTSSAEVHIAAAGRSYDVLTSGVLTVSGAAPPTGSQLPIRQLDIYATIFDDTVTVADTMIDVGGGLKAVGLSNIGSVSVFGGDGLDTFHVMPSTSTSFFIDGGAPIGFGDTLNVSAPGAAFHAGPESDDGAFFVTGRRPVTFDRIESANATLNAPVISGPSGDQRNPRPELTWSLDPNATSYELESIWLTGNSDPVVTEQFEPSHQPIDDLPIGLHQFRVRGVLPGDLRSDWSDAFTVGIRPVSQLSVSRFSRDPLPQVQWTPVAGAVRYDLWVDNLTTGQSQFIREQALAETMFTPAAPLPIGKYVVWLRAIGPDSYPGSWTSSQLDVITPTEVVSPIGAVVSGRPTFEWKPVAGAESYDLWVRQLTPEYVSMKIRVENLTATTFTPAEPLPAGTYRVWVQAQGVAGYAAAWSSPETFSTFAQIAILGPASANATAASAITWTSVAGAVRYELEVTNSTGGLVVHETGLTQTSFAPPQPLETGQEYSVRVRAVDATGESGPWSLIHRFRTPPARVALIAPGGGAAVSVPVTFTWQSATGAARYELWVNRIAPSPATRVLYVNDLASTEFTVPTLPAGTYRWWVRAINPDGRAGLWSAALTFTV